MDTTELRVKIHNTHEEVISYLLQEKIIQHGDFTLKSGKKSSIYVDMRRAISVPALLRKLAYTVWEEIQKLNWSLECVCPVPYGAVPLATCLSITQNIPMIMQRKERKTYGNKQLLEGIIEPNMRCMVIEDVTTTGQSAFETVEILRTEGYTVEGVLVFLDREEGAENLFKKSFIPFHSVLTLADIRSFS